MLPLNEVLLCLFLIHIEVGSSRLVCFATGVGCCRLHPRYWLNKAEGETAGTLLRAQQNPDKGLFGNVTVDPGQATFRLEAMLCEYLFVLVPIRRYGWS